MGETTIEWTATYNADGTVSPGFTFNPWIGCHKVSPGCKNCYAEALMDKRYGRVEWGLQGTRIRTSEANWRKPLAWNRKAEAEGRRYRVFCASLADVFEDKPDQPEMDNWRRDLFEMILSTPHLDWLLLTKRPENVNPMIEIILDTIIGPDLAFAMDWNNGRLLDNIWIGTSVENQEQANIRIPALLEIPAKIRFLSAEPLLGPVDIADYLSYEWGEDHGGMYGDFTETNIHWVIVGGESGPNARPMNPKWARSLRDECQAAGVPFFMKQWGEWLDVDMAIEAGIVNTYTDTGRLQYHHGHRKPYVKVGKKAAGRLLDGREWNQFPQHLQK